MNIVLALSQYTKKGGHLKVTAFFLCGKPKSGFCPHRKGRNMAYSSGILRFRIQVLNRKAATGNQFGIDGDGIEWEEGDCLHANVTWAKGARAMNAGALDAYAVKEVRTRWTNKITMRSRVKFEGQVYQIIPETFHEDKHENTLQFHMQLIVNDK